MLFCCIRPQKLDPAYPALDSQGLGKFSWLPRKPSRLEGSTREGVLTLTKARAQLRAAYQRQTILRYCTVYGVNEKNKK